jgi:1-deoxy-D-xylulose-5-phosphate synthase
MNNTEPRRGAQTILSRIDAPADLRTLTEPELKRLSGELREYLIDVISQIGGHLGAGLGAVELAVALHYVFNTPEDQLVWDVGHQAYPHKILTGRREALRTIRQFGGISGFLRREESEYDVFGAGHASTAISAALGVAAARDLSGKKFKVIAVVGDGAMTGGMVYEAMNNAGLQKRNMIVVLNDNNMSIAPNVWSLANYFTELIANPSYNRFKANVWDLAGKLDTLGDRLRRIAGRVEEGIKVVITPGMLFEALGFRYFGPINGHNLSQMLRIFREVKDLPGPILVHAMTRKGKGYKPAEADVQALHGVTPFDKLTGRSPKAQGGAPSYTKVFGAAVVELAKRNDKVVGITAAMPDGTGLDQLQQALPARFFDVGIAEQHGVTFASGLATQGYIPIVAIYSTFLQRAYDQVVHDAALQNLHIVLCLDRAGLVGADGPTHHGMLDLAYLRCIQNMVVMAPRNENELRHMLYTAVEYRGGPIAIRYPRGNAVGVPPDPSLRLLPIGRGEVVRQGKDIAILAIGNMVDHAERAAGLLAKDGIDAEVVDMKFVKPIDAGLVAAVASRHSRILTVEDHVVDGGFGSAVLETLRAGDINGPRVRVHGVPSRFIEHGTQAELYAMLKLDAPGIASVVKDFFRPEQSGAAVTAAPSAQAAAPGSTPARANLK